MGSRSSSTRRCGIASAFELLTRSRALDLPRLRHARRVVRRPGRSSSGARTPPARRASSRRWSLLAWGRSHRTSDRRRADPLGRATSPGSRAGSARDALEVAVVRVRRRGSGGRKRIRVNGVGRAGRGARRAAARRPLRARGHAARRRLAVAPAGGPRPARGGRARPAYADDLATYGRALQQRNSLLRAIREETATARRAALLGHAVPRRRRRGRDGAAARSSARWPSRSRPPTPRSPRRRPRPAGWPALRHQRAGTARRDAARRPRPPPRRDGREGALERHDARRAAPRRRRVRARRPGPRRLRLARPAADRDPRASSWPSWTC